MTVSLQTPLLMLLKKTLSGACQLDTHHVRDRKPIQLRATDSKKYLTRALIVYLQCRRQNIPLPHDLLPFGRRILLDIRGQTLPWEE